MTTPTIFSGSYTNVRQAPVLRNGALQLVETSAAVPAATLSGTVIGLVPFQAGARISYASRLLTTDLDTSTNVTLDVGYVYTDNVTYTNDPDAFVAASTTAQTGGIIQFTATAGFNFVAAADGWFTVTIGGGNTVTAGTISSMLEIAYDAD